MTPRKLINEIVTRVDLEGEDGVIASQQRMLANTEAQIQGNKDLGYSALKALKAEQKREAVYKESGAAMQQMGKAAGSLVRLALKLEKRMDGFEKKTKKTKRELSLLRRTLDRARKSAGAFSNKWTEINSKLEVGGKVARGVASAFEKALAKPAILAVDFETGLARIRTLGRETAGELEQGLSSLAKRVPQNLNDITAAAYDAISAQGERTNAQILNLLDNSSKVATGAQITLTEAVNGLTGATNAYGPANLSAKQAADILFSTMRVGKTTVEELIASQGKSLSSASALGVSYEEVGAAIAEMTSKGVSTAEAFTRLDAILTLLSKPTRQQRKAFDALNEGLGDNAFQLGVSDLKAKGLARKLVELQKATGGSSEALSTLTGRNKEAFQALTQVIGPEGAGGLLTKLREIQGGAGDAAKAFGIFDKTTAGAFARLKSEFEATLVEIGKVLLPEVNRGISTLRQYIADLSPDDIAAIAAELKRVAQTIVRVGASLLRSLTAAAPIIEKMIGLVVRIGDGFAQSVDRIVRGADAIGRVFSKVGSDAKAAFTNIERAIAKDRGLDKVEASIRRVHETIAQLNAERNGTTEFWRVWSGQLDQARDSVAASTTVWQAFDGQVDQVVDTMLEVERRHIAAEASTKALEVSVAAMASQMPVASHAASVLAVGVSEVAKQESLAVTAINEMTVDMARQLAVMAQFPGAAVAVDAGIRAFVNFRKPSPIKKKKKKKKPPKGDPRQEQTDSGGPTSADVLADEGPLNPSWFEGAATHLEAFGISVEQMAGNAATSFRSFAADAQGSISGISSSMSAFGASAFASFNQAAVGAILYQGSLKGVANAVLRTLAEQGLGLAIENTGHALSYEAKFAAFPWPGFRLAANKSWAAAGVFGGLGALSGLVGSQTGAFSRGGGGGGVRPSATSNGGFGAPTSRDFGLSNQRRREGPTTIVMDFSGASRLSAERNFARAVFGTMRGSVRVRGGARLDRRVIGRAS